MSEPGGYGSCSQWESNHGKAIGGRGKAETLAGPPPRVLMARSLLHARASEAPPANAQSKR